MFSVVAIHIHMWIWYILYMCDICTCAKFTTWHYVTLCVRVGYLFFGSISISPLFLILSLFFLVHFVLELVSVFVVIYVCPVPITFFVVFFVLVSPSLFVCYCEVLFLCKGRRYVCHIFHVINLPHENMCLSCFTSFVPFMSYILWISYFILVWATSYCTCDKFITCIICALPV